MFIDTTKDGQKTGHIVDRALLLKIATKPKLEKKSGISLYPKFRSWHIKILLTESYFLTMKY